MLNEIGALICHQIPERSFFIAGQQLFVCARDVGIYLGFLFALVIIYILKEYRNQRIDLRIIFLLILPMALDGMSQFLGLRESVNSFRLATGLLAGMGIAYLGVLIFPKTADKKLPSPTSVLACTLVSFFIYLGVYLALLSDSFAVFLLVNYLTFIGFLGIVGMALVNVWFVYKYFYKNKALISR